MLSRRRADSCSRFLLKDRSEPEGLPADHLQPFRLDPVCGHTQEEDLIES